MAQYIAWEQEGLDRLESVLGTMVGEVVRGVVPSDIAKAREAVSAALRDWWSHLWYVVELGIDAQ
jgi:hypothetical protein